jgi:hypothetical protein
MLRSTDVFSLESVHLAYVEQYAPDQQGDLFGRNVIRHVHTTALRTPRTPQTGAGSNFSRINPKAQAIPLFLHNPAQSMPAAPMVFTDDLVS